MDLATRNDLEELVRGEELKKLETKVGESLVRVDASARCVNANVEKMREFLEEFSEWAQRQSGVELWLFAVSPDRVLAYFDGLVTRGLDSITASKQHPGAALHGDAPLQEHVEGLQTLEHLRADFENNSDECVNQLLGADTTSR